MVVTYSKNSAGETVPNNPATSAQNVPTGGSSGQIPVGGQMTGQAKANIDALPTYSAPGSPGTQPIASSGAEGRALNDSTGTGGSLPGVTPQVSPTTQPTPGTVDAGAGLPGNTIGQGSYNAQTGTLTLPGTPTSADLRQGLANAQASKKDVPQSGGASDAISEHTPITNQPVQDTTVQNYTNPVTNPLVSDQAQQMRDLIYPQADRDMVKDYMDKLQTDQTELANTKLELMNINNIMSGSEQDIRDEITKANGFATNSQVLGLTIGRNQTLMQKKTQLEDQLATSQANVASDTTLVGDAKSQASQDISVNMGILNYLQKTQDDQHNALQSAAKTQISTPAGLSTLASNPQLADTAEKVLGLAPGTVSAMAKEAIKQSNLDTSYKQAQLSNINSEINSRNIANTPGANGTLNGKPQTASQSAANLYGDRLNESNVVLDTLGDKFTGKGAIGGILPNFLQSGDRQAYEQAKKNFVTAVLRRESGAAISPTEFTTAESQYFPQPGDKPAVLTQKESLRNTVINNFYKEANTARPLLPNMVFESGGKKYKVATDGVNVEETK